MRSLLKHRVRTAIEVGLLDPGVVGAVDGTKIAANAAGDQTYDASKLERLLARAEAAISDLEIQNEGGDDPPPPQLTLELKKAQALREPVRQALDRLAGDHRFCRVNLKHKDAQLMKGQQGILSAYNAQAMVSPLNLAGALGRAC